MAWDEPPPLWPFSDDDSSSGSEASGVVGPVFEQQIVGQQQWFEQQLTVEPEHRNPMENNIFEQMLVIHRRGQEMAADRAERASMVRRASLAMWPRAAVVTDSFVGD